MNIVQACNRKFDKWLEENTGKFSKIKTGYGRFDREILDAPNFLDNPDNEWTDYASILRNNR